MVSGALFYLDPVTETGSFTSEAKRGDFFIRHPREEEEDTPKRGKRQSIYKIRKPRGLRHCRGAWGGWGKVIGKLVLPCTHI